MFARNTGWFIVACVGFSFICICLAVIGAGILFFLPGRSVSSEIYAHWDLCGAAFLVCSLLAAMPFLAAVALPNGSEYTHARMFLLGAGARIAIGAIGCAAATALALLVPPSRFLAQQFLGLFHNASVSFQQLVFGLTAIIFLVSLAIVGYGLWLFVGGIFSILTRLDEEP